MEKNKLIIACILLAGIVAGLLVMQLFAPQPGAAGTGTSGNSGSTASGSTASGSTGASGTGTAGSNGTAGQNASGTANPGPSIGPVKPAPQPAAFGTKVGEEANSKWGRKGIIYPATAEVADEGWFRNSFNLPGDIRIDNICAIFMQGNATRQLSDGTTFIERPAVNLSGSQVCEIKVAGGAVAGCGGLTLHMDLEAMKTGYVKAEDNWKDFFSCQPGVNATLCSSECGLMLETLMYQKRSPMVNGSNP